MFVSLKTIPEQSLKEAKKEEVGIDLSSNNKSRINIEYKISGTGTVRN